MPERFLYESETHVVHAEADGTLTIVRRRDGAALRSSDTGLAAALARPAEAASRLAGLDEGLMSGPTAGVLARLLEDAPFQPEMLGFIALDLSGLGFKTYEYRNHTTVDGRFDAGRINLYMTRDGTFTTLYCGLAEPLATQALLSSDADEAEILDGYHEPLFAGRLTHLSAARVVLAALGVGASPASSARRWRQPQRLTRSKAGHISCELLTEG